MDSYHYQFVGKQPLKLQEMIHVGVAGSGNVEICIQKHSSDSETLFTVHTPVLGYQKTWKAVITQFFNQHPFGGLAYTLRDAGASPSVVSLRLRQAIETCQTGYERAVDYLEASARSRIYSIVDPGSFQEFLLGDPLGFSPNLTALNMPIAADDGVIVGRARLDDQEIAIAAQEKDFIGGSVGEVHGAKLIGIVEYAMRHKIKAIVFLIDSGGVRLQEANVGEIAISELIRAILSARSQGIKTIGVIAGSNGAYGGMGIISGVLDELIVTQNARIGVSGAEVIQAVKGKEVFDSSDRPLVWRVYGGRTRYLQDAARTYTSRRIQDLRAAIVNLLPQIKSYLDVHGLNKRQEYLCALKNIAGDCREEGEWLAKDKGLHHAQSLFSVEDQKFLAEATIVKNSGPCST